MRFKTRNYMKRLAGFLAEARRNSEYESLAGKRGQKLKDGLSRISPYISGKFSYNETYNGLGQFKGREEISSDGEVIWAREYEGAALNAINLKLTEELYGFLDAALRNFPGERPFQRGPEEFRKGDYVYTDVCKGDMISFKGSETILYKGIIVYALAYGGGLVKV